MNAVLARSPRSNPMPLPDESRYTDDYRVMVLEPGKAMRYLDDNCYFRSEAVAVFATFNRANDRRRQTAVVVRVGKPTRKIEVAADGDRACERVVEIRPLLIVYPTRQELEACDLTRAVDARKRA